MKKIETTLLYLRKNGRILLAYKKRGFGEGKFNGIGGKLEPNETPEQAMVRETQEEIGVTPTEYEKVAVINFLEFMKGEQAHVKMNVYIATDWDGEPIESDEMRPEWFDEKKLPFDKTLPDDEYWLPLVLAGKKVTAQFHFDENFEMLSHEVKEGL